MLNIRIYLQKANMMANKNVTNFSGKLLVAMPQLQDSYFSHSVIYICHHDNEGTMGLVLTNLIHNMSFADVVNQLAPENMVNKNHTNFKQLVRSGGPVEIAQGFLLHSPDYHNKHHSTQINEDIYLNANIDIIRDISENHGPNHFIPFLGYAGWDKGQLEDEILKNSWLHCTPDSDFIWRTPPQDLWGFSLELLGLSKEMLSSQAGHG